MKIFITLLLCLVAFNAHAQKDQIKQLLSLRNINTSNILDICSQDLNSDEVYEDAGLSFQLSNEGVNESRDSFINDIQYQLRSKKVLSIPKKMVANSVSITVLDGFTFHIADYYGHYGHSRIITCLDGNMRGYQEIADNGVSGIGSSEVKWHKGYFVHNYPNAKIYSYPDKQIFKIKRL